MIIRVINETSANVRFVCIKKGKTILNFQTDSNGVAKVSRRLIKDCDSIKLQYFLFKPISIKINKQENLDYNIRPYHEDEIDYHIQYITNNGSGFKMKYEKNELRLKYPKIKNHKQQEKWVKFIKE